MAQAERSILLENKSDIAQWVYFNDKRETISGYGTKSCSPALARMFIDERGAFIREFQSVNVPPLVPGEGETWVANMTGNPFVDPKIATKRIHRGKEEELEIDNPLFAPRIIKHKMNGGQRIQPCLNDPSSMESINLPATHIMLPPYRRVKIGSISAEWLLRRDMQQLEFARGQIRTVDAPHSFEPNEAWALDDLRIMAKLVSPEIFNREHSDFGDVLGPEEAELRPEEVDNAAVELWHKLFFFIIDERYPAVTEQEFNDVKKSLQAKRPKASGKENARLAEAARKIQGGVEAST